MGRRLADGQGPAPEGSVRAARNPEPDDGEPEHAPPDWRVLALLGGGSVAVGFVIGWLLDAGDEPETSGPVQVVGTPLAWSGR